MRPLGLDTLGIPAATARIVAFFARNPTARPTVRELQRTLGVASASAQRDLDRLTRGGALRSVTDGRLLRYAPVMDSPVWSAVRLLITAERAPAQRSQVRERAARYGVDLTQLDSMLRLTIEERLRLLDENSAFVREVRSRSVK